MGEYFTITGYWKDTNENFDNYIVTNLDNFPNENEPYTDDDIFMYGFDEHVLSDAVAQKWNTIHDFVITEYIKIIQ